MSPLSSSIIDSIDSTVDVPVEKDEMVEKAIRQCVEELPTVSRFLSSPEGYDHYASLDIPALNPIQIDLVLQGLLHTPRRYTSNLSTYVSVLLQKSYDAGNNGFTLHTQNILLDDLCRFIHGTEQKRLNMTVYGDTSNFTGKSSQWCSVRHEGDAEGAYFEDASNNEIFISGIITVESFYTPPLKDSMNNRFMTTNQETFTFVKNTLRARIVNEKNSVFLVDPAGKVLDQYSEQEEV